MSSIKSRIVLGAWVLVIGVTLGCGPSSRTAPAPSNSTNASSTDAAAQPSTDTVPAGGGPTATAPAASLGIGDAAPPLSIQSWIGGEPLAELATGQVYVVEFWATWCPPCRTSMPHLSALQQKYGETVCFVGVTDEPEATVREFLAKEQSAGKTWAEVVKYRLALDNQNATEAAYMQAAGQSGIPTAFIVGKDRVIEWIGHPMAMDGPLAKIAAGEWDRPAAVAEFRQQQKLEEAASQLNDLIQAEQWDQGLALLDRLEKETAASANLTRMKLVILRKAGRTDAAAAVQAQLVEQSWDDAASLNDIAWGIATGTGTRDLPLALKAAERAAELSQQSDAAILDTLARVFYEQGQLDQAIEWQKKAVEHNQGNASIDETLKQYEAEKAAPAPAPKPAP